VHLFTTVIQRLDYNVSRYFVCIKCTARPKFLAGLHHKPSSVRTRLIVVVVSNNLLVTLVTQKIVVDGPL